MKKQKKPDIILKNPIVYEEWDETKQQKKLKWHDNNGHKQPMEYLSTFNRKSLKFVHIPKTGGTSIGLMFSDKVKLENTMYPVDWEQSPWAPMPTYRQELNTESNEIEFKRLTINSHITAIQKKYIVTQTTNDSNQIIETPDGTRIGPDTKWDCTACLVRNPYDRVVSLYYYGKQFWKYKEGMDVPEYPEFEQWVEDVFGRISELTPEEMHDIFSEVRAQSETLPVDNSKWFTPEIIVKMNTQFPHFYMPQFYFITDNDDKKIIENVVKLEDAKGEMPQKGVSNTRPNHHYSYFYNQRTYDVISNYFTRDLASLNYEFENAVGTSKIDFEINTKFNNAFKTEKSSYARRHEGKKRTNYKGK